jgi:hypothetical protein
MPLIRIETGSYQTAHTTIQSFQTADLRVGSKEAVSAGIFAGHSALSLSGDTCGLSGRFLASRLCIQKFRSPRQGFLGQYLLAAGNMGVLGGQNRRFEPGRDYRGFSPRASNCWLHSAGASRSRSTPMPRGSRPSTAARTRSGARNASEIVMLT